MQNSSRPRTQLHLFQRQHDTARLPAGPLCHALGVSGLIRIQAADWLLIPASGTPFWHFNLGPTPHQPGQTYALARILRAGVRDGPREIPPLLASDTLLRARVLRCVHTDEAPRLNRLEPAPVLLQQVSEESLLQELGQRYGKTAEELEEVLADAGVSCTLLVVDGQLALPDIEPAL